MVTVKQGRLISAGLLVALLAVPNLAAAQVADPKADFTEALAQFSLALDGTYGDEGPRILSSLESMERGLAKWDETIRAYESGIGVETKGAEPKLAALAHLALGGVYLDRNRTADALREFATAGTLDPDRADAYALQGLASSQPLAPNPAAAIAAFQKASALDPTDVVRAYLLARQLARAGKTDEAAATFRLVVANQKRHAGERTVAISTHFMRFGIVEEKTGVDPFFPPAAYAEGFALLARGEYAQAIVALRESAARDVLIADQTNRYGMRRGADAFRQASLDTAIQQLKAAIELAPDRAEPHRILGLVYAADEQYDLGIAALRKAVDLGPADERARLALADVFVRAEQYEAAEQVLRETIIRLPRSGRAHYTLARLYQRQGRDAEAVQEFAAAVTFGPLLGLNGIYRAMGALSAARQNFDAAIDAYTRRVELHPNDAGAHLDLGQTNARLGRIDEALAEFAVALTIDPEKAETHASVAQLYLGQSQYAESADAARRALDLDPSHRQARYVLATSLIRLGRADEGQRELDEFQRLQALDAAAHARDFELGGLRREASVSSANGDHEKAVGLLRKALELEPNAAVSHVNLGLALLRAGQPAEAVTRFQAAAALNDPTPLIDVHRYLAEAYSALGRDEEGRRELAAYEQLKHERLQRSGAAR
jgi:tetratricopeptide (TPR) repeat protein